MYTCSLLVLPCVCDDALCGFQKGYERQLVSIIVPVSARHLRDLDHDSYELIESCEFRFV